MAAETIGNSKIAALATVIAAKSLETLHAKTVAAQVLRFDWANEVATKGKIVAVNKYAGGFVANDKVENTDVTVQDRSSSLVNITLDQHKEVTFLVEDITRALSSVDVFAESVQEAIATLAEQLDKYAFGKYAAFTAVDATSTNGPIDAADFTTISTALNKANVPMGNRFAILSADDYAKVADLDGIRNRDYAGDSAILANAGLVLPQYKTFTPVMSNLITNASSEYKNLFIHKSAIAVATRPLPVGGEGVYQTVMNENGLSIRVSISYDDRKLAWKVTADCLFGASVMDANRGRTLRTASV